MKAKKEDLRMVMRSKSGQIAVHKPQAVYVDWEDLWVWMGCFGGVGNEMARTAGHSKYRSFRLLMTTSRWILLRTPTMTQSFRSVTRTTHANTTTKT